MHHIAEEFIAEGIVADVLDRASAIRKRVRLLQVVRSRVREPFQKRWPDGVVPRGIDDRFMGQNRIGVRSCRAGQQKDKNQ